MLGKSSASGLAALIGVEETGTGADEVLVDVGRTVNEVSAALLSEDVEFVGLEAANAGAKEGVGEEDSESETSLAGLMEMQDLLQADLRCVVHLP
jgi:hypothetical protein